MRKQVHAKTKTKNPANFSAVFLFPFILQLARVRQPCEGLHSSVGQLLAPHHPSFPLISLFFPGKSYKELARMQLDTHNWHTNRDLESSSEVTAS